MGQHGSVCEGTRSKDRGFSGFLLGICLGFYVFFALWDGAVIAVDSESYINMEISREPLYPLILAAFRTAFASLAASGAVGELFYLDAVALCQSILMAFAAWILVRYLQRELRLPRMLTLALLAMPFAVSLLCRFAAARGAMYSNHILTEGITIPLYLLFFRFLLEYCLHRTRRSGIWCLVISFLLYSTRKQMVIALVMWMLCFFAAQILSGQNNDRPAIFSRGGRAADEEDGAGTVNGAASAWDHSLPGRAAAGLAGALLSAAVVLGGSTCFDIGYNYILRGEAVRHTSDTRFLTTMAFYTAERADADYIEDDEIRELFLAIYDACDAQGYLMHSAGEGWLNRVEHFGDHYDNIQIDTMWPAINSYVRELTDGDNVSINVDSDDIMDVINAAILPHNIGKLLRCFADNFLSGLVTTVAQRKPVLIIYSALIYLLYAGLLVFHGIRCIRAGRNAAAQAMSAEDGPFDGKLQGGAAATGDEWLRRRRIIVLFALLTLVSIACNVGLVSLVIFCQTRYTIYNMPLFYISLILMLYMTAGNCSEERDENRW